MFTTFAFRNRPILKTSPGSMNQFILAILRFLFFEMCDGQASEESKLVDACQKEIPALRNRWSAERGVNGKQEDAQLSRAGSKVQNEKIK